MALKSYQSDFSRFAARRRAALKPGRSRGKVDALLVTRENDVSYLSGFAGDSSYLLFGPGWANLLTDGRYTEQAAGECPGVEVVTRRGPMWPAVADALKGNNVRRLGIQADHITLAMQTKLRKALGKKKIEPIPSLTGPLRVVKDASELATIRKAVRIAQRAWRSLMDEGAKYFIGKTEQRIAAELDYRMRLEGADAPAFATIVAFGSHGSLPHYLPGRRKARKGMAMLFDWGARVGGYCSDLTRVAFIDTIPPELSEIYDVVLEAQKAGIRAIRPGVQCSSVDAAARNVIEKAGCGEQFVHSLGHGIGRDVHESPGLAASVNTPMRSGMVTTVEPGIYRPGVGGIRIEDDILVTADGRKRLSSLPREIDKMVLQ